MNKHALLPAALLVAAASLSACSPSAPATPTATTTAMATATTTAAQPTATATATQTTTAAQGTGTSGGNQAANDGAAAPCINTNLALTHTRNKDDDYVLTLKNIGAEACQMEENPVVALVSGPNDVTMFGAPAEHKVRTPPFVLKSGATSTVTMHPVGGTRPQTCGSTRAWGIGIKPQRDQLDKYVVSPLQGELAGCADRNFVTVTVNAFQSGS